MRSGRGTDGIRLLHFYLAGNKLHTWKIYISVVTLFTFSFINPIRNIPSRRIIKVEQRSKTNGQLWKKHRIQSPAVSLRHKLMYHLCVKKKKHLTWWGYESVCCSKWLLNFPPDPVMSQPRESIFHGKLQQTLLLKILVITLSNATRSVEKTKCVLKK